MATALIGTIVIWDTVLVYGKHHKYMPRADFDLFLDKVPCICVNLYSYTRSGLTTDIQTSKWYKNASAGAIYITSENARKVFGSDCDEDKVKGILQSEVEAYDAYLCGEEDSRFEYGRIARANS